MMKKLVVFLFCLSLILSACGGTTPATQAVAASTSEPAVVAATSAPEPVTLRLSAWGSPEQNAPTEAMINAFMAKYPYITVEMEFDPYDGYWEKKTTQVAGEQLPDVFAMSTFYICEYVAAGRLLDLTSYLSDPTIAAFQTGLPSSAMANLTFDGKVYGFPYATGTVVMYYNKDMFDAAGVGYPQPGWTYTDMLDAAAKLTKDTNGDGMIDQFGYLPGLYSQDNVEALFHTFGARMYSDDGKTSTLDTPEAITAVQFMQDLMYKYNVAPTVADVSGIDDPFGAGMIAMTIGLVADMGSAQEITAFKWDIAAPPLGYDGQAGAGSIRGNPNYVVSAQTAHPAEAALLAGWMAGPEAQTILGAAKGRFPVNEAGQAQWLSAPPEHFAVIIDLMKNDVQNEPLCINHKQEVLDAWNQAFESDILTNSKPAAEILPALNQQIQTILDTP